ncbi:F-box and leucine-rich repeat protein 4 [Linnemannia zychae]|nr:F-box and leucine-rich repeat protein 4 [Linnemannia zychae]
MSHPLQPQLASAKVLSIPEILALIFDCLSIRALRNASLVCREWERLGSKIISQQIIIPNDWFSHDLTVLFAFLDRRGENVKALSLELSSSTRLVREVDMEHMVQQLENILTRTPNVERLDLQVPREVKSNNVLATVGRHAKRLQQFETNLLNWDSVDMATLLTQCLEVRHLSGHNFTGDVLQAIATSQPLLTKIDCTHPRFDDDELISFAKQVPKLLRLSVSQHQFLTAKALIGVADYCSGLEYLDFHFCLSLQSIGFQALLWASPNLRVLDLGLTECHDADIVLVANQCRQLEYLKLPFCGNLTQASVRAIVHSCTELLHLDVSFCDKIMLTIFDGPSTLSSSSSSPTPTSSSSSPWVCLKLQYLDISGIHSSYSADVSVASALLPAMYHQLSLLTELRTLKLSGQGFSLRLLEEGRSGLQKLRKLETLNIAKLRNPLPWKDIIEIGNIFPRLIELQFRSNDVIPPQATQEQEDALEGHHRSKRGKFVDVQPEPLYQEEEGKNAAQDTSTSLPAALLVTVAASTTVTNTSLAGGSGSTPTLVPSESSLSKRKRSRSPSPTPTPTTTYTDTDAVAERSVQQVDEDKSNENKQTREEPSNVLSATLRSGLKISFRLSGEDEDDTQGGPGAFGAGGEVIGWGFPDSMPF